MRKISIALLFMFCACASSHKAPVGLDHYLIFVSRDAPERAVMEQAGFRVAPGLNEHEGQGTASITFEFENSFVELVWPDERVAVAPELGRAFEKFKSRSAWRTSGWSPIGIALHRVGPPVPLPVPSWSVSAPWMAPGTSLEVLTARDDTKSPSVSVHPGAVSEDPARDIGRRELRAAGAMNQPNGVKRVTAARIIMPADYQPVAALTYLQSTRVLALGRGDAWTLELTFDRGAQGRMRDFRPELPLKVIY
ncbi:MAG TPA: VOC family protein [Thermoanaerobaculia bacterium]|nr:VOC family protein [Thermoanaerobaculia bacterium]